MEKRQRITLKELLQSQCTHGDFNRMDIIVRYMAIEQYYGENRIGFALFNKMQKKRKQKKHDLKRFKALIDSIEKYGYNGDSEIKVNKDRKLIDGSHRVACALYFNVNSIPIQTITSEKKIDYSLKWFENQFS